VVSGREKKDILLGMPFGTANGRLRKAIMFHLVCRLKENFCHRCDGEILTSETFSIEHKKAWQSAADPVAAFFDIANISFSHHACNVSAASRPYQRYANKREQEKARRSRPLDKEKQHKIRKDWRQIRRDAGLPYT
jgi:CHAD domain-containing protein